MSATPAARGVPAPLVVVGGLVAGALLQLARALPAPPAPGRWYLGGLLLLLGLPFGFGAFARMRRAKTSPNPYRPTTALVVDGPFRFSRNPMYVSFVLYFLGLSVLLGLTWSLLLTPLVVAILHFGSIVPEERHLEARFGEAFRAYRARVRPWL